MGYFRLFEFKSFKDSTSGYVSLVQEEILVFLLDLSNLEK